MIALSELYGEQKPDATAEEIRKLTRELTRKIIRCADNGARFSIGSDGPCVTLAKKLDALTAPAPQRRVKVGDWLKCGRVIFQIINDLNTGELRLNESSGRLCSSKTSIAYGELPLNTLDHLGIIDPSVWFLLTPAEAVAELAASMGVTCTVGGAT